MVYQPLDRVRVLLFIVSLVEGRLPLLDVLRLRSDMSVPTLLLQEGRFGSLTSYCVLYSTHPTVPHNVRDSVRSYV